MVLPVIGRAKNVYLVDFAGVFKEIFPKSSNSVESLGKALENEKIVSELVIAEKDAVSAKLRKEKQTRIAAEVERDALRSMRAATNSEKDAALSNLSREKELRVGAEIERDALRAMRATSENEKVVLLGMKAIAEAERDALRGRLPLEWIDGISGFDGFGSNKSVNLADKEAPIESSSSSTMVVGMEASSGSCPTCSRDCLLLVTLLFTISLGTRDQDALNCEKKQKGSRSIV
ncbi:hypothetical protein EZV62_000087 [Acer yangbiense]|uniref:Uncharacterized protein n=1 Tax=Acer yangbiense TaxID=1000413 RepID=A0A5C7IQY8_9ROSI|nr:hypothetical protein EZV62_000087 [Acer yangbiense]